MEIKDEEQRRFSKGKGFRFKIGFIELLNSIEIVLAPRTFGDLHRRDEKKRKDSCVLLSFRRRNGRLEIELANGPNNSRSFGLF